MTLRLHLVLSFTLVVLVTAASVLVIVRQTSAADVRTFMGAGGGPNSTQLFNRLSGSSFLAADIGSAVGLLVALWLSYRLLKPVTQLTRAASRLAKGDLSQRVDEQGQMSCRRWARLSTRWQARCSAPKPTIAR